MIFFQDEIKELLNKELNKNTFNVLFDVALFNADYSDEYIIPTKVENMLRKENLSFCPILIEDIGGERLNVGEEIYEVNVMSNALIPLQKDRYKNKTFKDVISALDETVDRLNSKYLPFGDTVFVTNSDTNINYNAVSVDAETYSLVLQFEDTSPQEVFRYKSGNNDLLLSKTATDLVLSYLSEDNTIKQLSLPYFLNREYEILVVARKIDNFTRKVSLILNQEEVSTSHRTYNRNNAIWSLSSNQDFDFTLSAGTVIDTCRTEEQIRQWAIANVDTSAYDFGANFKIEHRVEIGGIPQDCTPVYLTLTFEEFDYSTNNSIIREVEGWVKEFRLSDNFNQDNLDDYLSGVLTLEGFHVSPKIVITDFVALTNDIPDFTVIITSAVGHLQIGSKGLITFSFNIIKPITGKVLINEIEYQMYDFTMLSVITKDIYLGNQVKYYLDEIEIFPFQRNMAITNDVQMEQMIGAEISKGAINGSGISNEFTIYYKRDKNVETLIEELFNPSSQKNKLRTFKVVFPTFQTEYEVLVESVGTSPNIGSPIMVSISLSIGDDILEVGEL